MSEQGENLTTSIHSTPVESTPSPSSAAPNASPSQKRKRTSVVWNSFEEGKDAKGEKIATCQHCHNSLKASSKNETKHLHEHLARCVKRNNTDLRQQLLKAGKTSDGKVQFGNFTFDQDVSRNELANAIILHEYPLSIVDHYGFQKFIATLQPLFKMVSRNTIKSDVLKIYDVEKKKNIYVVEKIEQ